MTIDAATLAGLIDNGTPVEIIADWLEDQQADDREVCLLYARDKTACAGLEGEDCLPQEVACSLPTPITEIRHIGNTDGRSPRIIIPCQCDYAGHFYNVLLEPRKYQFRDGSMRVYHIGQCRACMTVYWEGECGNTNTLLPTDFPQALLAEWVERRFGLSIEVSYWCPEVDAVDVTHGEFREWMPGRILLRAFVRCQKREIVVNGNSIESLARAIKRPVLSFVPVPGAAAMMPDRLQNEHRSIIYGDPTAQRPRGIILAP